MFKYYLKKLLRNKSFLFWTLIFPIALMTCFKMAFGNIYNLENSFDPVKAVYVRESDIDIKQLINKVASENNLAPILEETGINKFIDLLAARDYEGLEEMADAGLLDEDKFEDIENIIKGMAESGYQFKISEDTAEKFDKWIYSYIFEMALDSVSDGDDQIFELSYADTIEAAEKKLENGEAKALIYIENEEIKTVVSENYGSVELNIISGFVGTFQTEYKVMKEIMFSNNESILSLTELNMESKKLLKAKPDAFSEEPNPYNWYYNATIVMAIMFNILAGIGIVEDTQADVSSGALRVSLASEKKSNILLASFLARLLVTVTISIAQLIIMNKGFGIPIGKRYLQLLLFVVVANIFAISVGQFFGLFLKGKINERENKANALLMISVFLSGEMMSELPGFLQLHCPIINQINPATILCFSFYKMVYYDDLTGFYLELLKIGIAAIVFFGISVKRMRRQRYASL